MKNFDKTQLIGMALIAGILIWMNLTSKNDKLKLPEEDKKTVIVAPDTQQQAANETILSNAQDSTAITINQPKVNGKEVDTVIENELLKITVSSKGAEVKEVLLKDFKSFDGKPLYLVKDNNAAMVVSFTTKDNRIIKTSDYNFTPILSKNGDNQVLKMQLNLASGQTLEYVYTLKPNEYMLDFVIQSQGLNNIINASNPVVLDWNMKTYSHEKSRKYENQYTELNYEKGEDEYDELNARSKSDEESGEDVNWVNFRQQYFSSILLNDEGFKKGTFESKNLMAGDNPDPVFTKAFSAKFPLTLQDGELANKKMQLYYGPTDFNLFTEQYPDKNLDRSITLGWGIFGFLNRHLFFPVFNFLKGFVGNFGLIIILLTIAVRFIMSPLLYKSYLSSAKMKVIRPEIEELNKKYPKDAMKRQQETMALNRKAGVNPMAGCIPALLQMPIFFALFRFFPSNIDLRQKGFLWSNDLSSYDSIMNLPFNIPMYGAHISGFALLAAVAIFFYMKMNQSQQANMQAPPQEGMPDMTGMMKMMIYLSPLMMLVFFNSYGSGLSLYYFTSNLLMITIMFIIKKFIIDEDKIHAQIQANKLKPKKQSKFSKKMADMMKQAEEQKRLQEQQKKGKK
jgi:YidC/Oxa1 family membrane protein insertase